MTQTENKLIGPDTLSVIVADAAHGDPDKRHQADFFFPWQDLTAWEKWNVCQ
jgi:hypothetical protein